MSSRENLTLELKIICANDVSHTNATEKMDVYGVVSLNGNNFQTQAVKTPIDNDGGSNPTWNHPVKFSANEKDVHEGGLTVNVKLYIFWIGGCSDLEVGEVDISVQELFASNPPPLSTNCNSDKMKLMTRYIGGTKTKLSFSYRFKRELASNNMYPSLSDYSSSSSSSFRYPTNDSGRFGQHVVNPPLSQTPTTKLTLDLLVKHTRDIKDNSWIHGMDIYASVTIRERKIVMHRSNTPIAYRVHKNPIWDHPMRFTFPESLAREGQLTLYVELINHRIIRGDKGIGKVKVPISELLSSYPQSTLTNHMKLVTSDVNDHHSEKIGTFTFMYKFYNEQATIPPAPIPTTTSQPFIIMYMPAPNK